MFCFKVKLQFKKYVRPDKNYEKKKHRFCNLKLIHR